MSRTTYKNPMTGEKFFSESACVDSIEESSSDLLKKWNITPLQLMFNAKNRLPLNTSSGKSVISGKPTLWNETARRYERFASDGERQTYRQIFLDRMRRVHGKDHLLDDPEHQRRMLASRSISGTYVFENGGYTKTYTGQEELTMLKFLDTTLQWPGYDIHCPAPQNFEYVGEDGKKHVYLPDIYIESLNLIIEVKGPAEHGGWKQRMLEIERRKDEVLGTSGYAYVKVEDQDYGDLIEKLAALKFEQERR